MGRPLLFGFVLSLCFHHAFSADNVTACKVTYGQAIRCEYSDGQLTDVPADIPDATTILIIKDSSISQIKKGSLDSLTNLHNLTIENVQLTRIEGAAFQKLTLLLRIDLRHNKLTAIQNSTFKGLHYLRHLELSYNSIATIQQGAFTSLINLKELHLEANKLNMLPAKLFHGLNIYTLNIRQNSIVTVNDAFTKCTVNKLYLQNNFINDIKDSILEPLSTSITVLDLSNNPLQEVPQGISSLIHLHQLLLSNVKIKHLPRDMISNMKKLSYLDISSNMFTAIDRELMAEFYRIKRVELIDNQWKCDCGILPLHTWLKKVSEADRKCANMSDFMEIANLGCLICITPVHFEGKAVTSLQYLDKNCTVVKTTSTITLDERVGIIAAAFCVFVLILGISIYCIKRRIFAKKKSYEMSVSRQALSNHNSCQKINEDIPGDNGIFTVSKTVLRRASSIESSI